MSKLLFKLPDGSTLDVPLQKERTTVGRRADNDICLPSLAVSGEHAAVVTILDDSFLEDLGSTNGTLVNGTSITKHFLRDGDEIDVGRHILIYKASAKTVAASNAGASSKIAAPAKPLEGAARIMARDFEQVAPAKPFAHAEGSHAFAPNGASPAATGNGGQTISTDSMDASPKSAHASSNGKSRSFGRAPASRQAPTPARQATSAKESAAASLRSSHDLTRTEYGSPRPDVAASARRSAGVGNATFSSEGAVSQGAATAPAAASLATLKVLSGALVGRSIPIVKSETTIGRAGLQVASITVQADGFKLKLLEGDAPPILNGRALESGDAELRTGDVIEIALTRLEFSRNDQQAPTAK